MSDYRTKNKIKKHLSISYQDEPYEINEGIVGEIAVGAAAGLGTGLATCAGMVIVLAAIKAGMTIMDPLFDALQFS